MKTYKDIVGDGGSDVIGQVTAQADRVKRRMDQIGHSIAIMSGKGGVGKSTITVNLAAALAKMGYKVGILDADISGPSVARICGVDSTTITHSTDGASPAITEHGLRVMSIDLFLTDSTDPVIWNAPTQRDNYTWRGMMEAAALRELVSDTNWGELDFLLIDLPPGADRLPNLTDTLTDLSGSIVVTIPSEISKHVVTKSIKLSQEYLNTPLLGIVENMATYVCPHCQEEEPLFSSGTTTSWAESLAVPVLGSVPFDPQVVRSADSGKQFLFESDDSIAARKFSEIAEVVRNMVMSE